MRSADRQPGVGRRARSRAARARDARARRRGERVRLRGAPTSSARPRASPSAWSVAGGDGTVAAVAELAGRLDVPLGVIPGGTANDFVRASGLPPDPVEAAVLAVTGHDAAAARARPPGRRAPVRQRRERRARLGGRTPRGAAQAAAGAARLRGRRGCAPRRPRRRCAAPCAPTARPCSPATAWQVIVAVTGAFGGGSGSAPPIPQDGVLDVAVLPGRLAARARPPRLGPAARHDRRASVASSTIAAT